MLRHVLPVRGCRQLATVPARFGSGLAFEQNGPYQKVLKLVQYDAPTPLSGQVTLRMLAAPIHYTDITNVESSKVNGSRFGGSEGVGEVVKVGNGVQDVKPGDWVVPTTTVLGTWRTELTCDAKVLRKVPNGIAPEYAALLGRRVPTAVALLQTFAPLSPDLVLVQNLANSTIGMLVMQLASAFQANVVNILSERPDLSQLRERLKDLGADVTVTRSYVDTPEMDNLLTDMPPPMVGFDGAGGKDRVAVAKLLGHGATLVSYGNRSGVPDPLSPELVKEKDLKLVNFSFDDHVASLTPEAREHLFQLSNETITNNIARIMVERHALDQSYLEPLERAQQRFLSRKLVFYMY